MIYQGKVPNSKISLMQFKAFKVYKRLLVLSYYRSNLEERRIEIASDPNTIRLEPSRRRTKPKKDIFKKLSSC